jgi:hypothetical protein
VEKSGVKSVTETKEFFDLFDYIQDTLKEKGFGRSANFTKKTLKVSVHVSIELIERIGFKMSMPN